MPVSKTSLHYHEAVPGIEKLEDLALDLIWSWNHATDDIWKKLDIDLWERTHNPWIVLQNTSKEQLQRALADPPFNRRVQEILDERKKRVAKTSWFKEQGAPISRIAYFSMEYMLSESLPIYSGGLGNVAGDQLKSASNLGVPVVGVGLLYQQGYFRQVIDHDGVQHAFYPFNSPEQLPICPLRKPNGEWLRLSISLPGWSVWLRTWEVRVGDVKLLLLDSNDAVNYPPHRGITSELYGGDQELRFKQEIVLGIGGWRLLTALGLSPEVCHLNEGHAAFVVLERAKSFMEKERVPFDVALNATRAGNLFTTHTAVSAGFDCFPPDLVRRFLGTYAEKELGISVEELLALGQSESCSPKGCFNMAYLAMRGCSAVNAVSQIHEAVSKNLFQPLFPRWPTEEIPIGHITNGVHVDTWTSAHAEALWDKTCGHDRWCGTTEHLEGLLKNVPDEQIWRMRSEARGSMIRYGRERITRTWRERGLSEEEIKLAQNMFSPDALTLGFARRFATYKRPNLLLHNRDRLLRILTNAERPVQLIIAGKAHPADVAGQAMIREWTHFAKTLEARPHVLFLSDYDMLMTQNLASGVDVWINTPRRPWEACGTSGMKMLVNGGLNLSVLDGWWAEAYSEEVGWALSDGWDPSHDGAEAEQLYDLLENSIIPEFYARNEQGIPIRWVAKIRESMARLTPCFSANRAVREYTGQYYLPAAAAYRERSQQGGALAAEISSWKRAWKDNGSSLRFGIAEINTQNGRYRFTVPLFLSSLDPGMVRVELFSAGSPPFTQTMTLVGEREGSRIYQAEMPADRPAEHYTARALAAFQGNALPLENSFILWQK